MPGEAIRSGDRHLTALLQVPCGPDTERFTSKRDDTTDDQGFPCGMRQPQHDDAEREPERHSQARDPLQELSHRTLCVLTWMAAVTSATVIDPRHQSSRWHRRS